MLENDSILADRVVRLTSIPGVGVILALTWTLEMGDVARFPRRKRRSAPAGCAAPNKVLRASRKGRRYQSSEINICKPLTEAAKVAQRWYPVFALLYDRKKQKGNRNQATLAIARKLVSYLLAVNRTDRMFFPQRLAPTKVQPSSA